MNRPKAREYDPSIDDYAFEHYVEDLEKYCDGLERALDKACEMLSDVVEDVNGKLWTKRHWKEWSLMIKIDNVDVYGFEAAIRGMRNPKNSWEKSDSSFNCDIVGDLYGNEHMRPELGENDLKLAKTLANAGTDHGKFLRMIGVTCDITAPAYWVAEHDTYKVSTVRNSCSFMHKGTSKPFELCDFSYAPENGGMLLEIVNMLNVLRESYLETRMTTSLSRLDNCCLRAITSGTPGQQTTRCLETSIIQEKHIAYLSGESSADGLNLCLTQS